jgi:hypothetical protein
MFNFEIIRIVKMPRYTLVWFQLPNGEEGGRIHWNHSGRLV